jgi:CBS domain-containing protein
MVSADHVIKCAPDATIRSVADQILTNKISAVVVLSGTAPVGIITKTDLTKAYVAGASLDDKADSIMSKDLKTVKHDLPRDDAAKVFEQGRIHHAIVVGENGEFAGLISAWDIAKECVLDQKAWPCKSTPSAFEIAFVA